MPTENVFPIEIATKENSPELLAWFQSFHALSLYLSAEEINLIVKGLNYLYENLGSETGAPADGENVMVYDPVSDSTVNLNQAIINLFGLVGSFDLQLITTNGAVTDKVIFVANGDTSYAGHTSKGMEAYGAGNSIIIDVLAATLSVFHANGRFSDLQPGLLKLKSMTGSGGELIFRGDNLSANLTIQAPDKTGTKVMAMTEDITNAVGDAVTQLIDGAPSDANTLKELNDKILAINAIIGGTTADGDSLVNTVAEILNVFQTYPEGSNIATVLAGKIASSDIINNLTQVVSGKVLDATQGKILKDFIDTLTTTVTANGVTLAAHTTSIAANTSAILLKQEMFIKHDLHILAPTWGSGTLNVVIGSTFTLTGSLTSRTFADTNLLTRTARVGIVSTAVAGNATSGRQVSGYFSRNTGFKYIVKFGSSDNAATAGSRSFIGITSPNNLSGNVEPDTMLNALGFCRISTSTNWHVLHNDSSGSGTLHDSGFPANTESDELMEGLIETVPNGIQFTLTRLSTGVSYSYTATTDIPSASFALALFFLCTNNTTVALAGVDWAGHKLKLGI
jgi:hypothetical protein